MAETELTAQDVEFLDAAFDRALERLEDGMTILADELIDGREYLRDEVQRLVQLAQEVVVGRPAGAPKVPGYAILSELGRGGMATVYLARQERAGGRLVALKVLPTSLNLHGRSRTRFEQEALSVARLRHPNIVTVHDVVTERDVLAYAMEWVEGKSLAQVIEYLKDRRSEGSATRSDQSAMDEVRRLLDADQRAVADAGYTVFICRIGIAVCRALAAVHEAGLLHRDVKPSNILLRRDGTPLLSDFGLARQAEGPQVTQEGQFLGTPAYAAPEQLRGSGPAVDPRSDVYALGVTLYHALSLVLPFSGTSTDELLRQIEAGKARPLRKITAKLPRDLETIIGRAMDLDPARRYSTAGDLADDLERLLSLQPIKARPAGLVTRTIKLARRNRQLFFGAVVGGSLALLVAVAAAVYFLAVPRWVKEHLDQAHLALLSPKQIDAFFYTEFYPLLDGSRERGGGATATAVEAALEHYDAALRLRPFDRALQRERDIVAGLIPRSPKPNPAEEQSEGRSAKQLRLAGLRAYLVGDAESAVEAWTQLDLLTDPDPFIEAALGYLYLAREEPARAYPRLREACKAFPNVGFLTIHLADAAAQCGDSAEAERLLQRAQAMDHRDDHSALDRVRADILATQGHDDEAESLYAASHTNVFSRLHHARFLESRGRLWEAATRYREAMITFARSDRPCRPFIDCAERWWSSLSDHERWRQVRAALDANSRVGQDFRWLLLAYADAYKRIDPHDSALRLNSPTRAPPYLGTYLLANIVNRVEVSNESRWADYWRYPSFFKTLQAAVWLSPWPEVGSKAVQNLAFLFEFISHQGRGAGVVSGLLPVAESSPKSRCVFDLAADWSDTENPNGVWSYNEGNNPLRQVSAWDNTVFDWIGSQPAWADSSTGSDRTPAWFKIRASTLISYDWQVGDVVTHSLDPFAGAGNGTGNVTWTSPMDGTMSVLGACWQVREINRGQVWKLHHNNELLTQGSLSRHDPHARARPFQFANGSGGPSVLLGRSVRVGDVVNLEILRDQSSQYGDLVGVKLTIEIDSPLCSDFSGP